MGVSVSSIILAVLLLVLTTDCAPRSKSRTQQPQTIYDQKQTGDYNIQLHLKDFQIIALLNDDSLGGLGDYDYNYDYSDFTVKPKPSTTTTAKPHQTSTTTIASTTQKLQYTSSSPQPIQTSSSTEPPLSQFSTQKPKPVNAELENRPPSSTMKPIEDSSQLQNSTKTDEDFNGHILDEVPSSPDRIKVQIIRSPQDSLAISNEATSLEEAVTDKNPVHQLGETMHYRKCPNGWSRDKRGKCRRMRRPGPNIPFAFGRLASDLAARLTGTSASIDSSISPDTSEE